MPDPMDWQQERSKAGSQTQRSLSDLAERAGFIVSGARGKGSHLLATRAGLARPVTIPAKIFRENALGVISQLQRGSE